MRATTATRGRVVCVFALFVVAASGNPVVGQAGPPPDYGIDFVTVGSPGNAAYDRPDPNGLVTGRGAVGYEYRIAREEVTTAQWLQFVNTFWTQGNLPNGFLIPTTWGAVRDLDYHGPGRRYMLQPGNPDAAMRPVFGIQWREAAEYSNWLCNGQASDPASLLNGAYDASTFTPNPTGGLNDQRTHNAGARFWIPTWDEWLKAAHFDPNRYGPSQGGYWLYDTSSDTQPVPGPPGTGQTSAGYILPNFGAQAIPLGAYRGTQSPWGLLDTSGGTSEWTEETLEEIFGPRRYRVSDGNWAGNEIYPGADLDNILELAANNPFDQAWFGLRIASSVPSASAGACVFIALCSARLARRRRLSAAWGALCVALSLLPSPGPAAFAQVGPPDYGIDFVTVGAPGNVGYSGFDPNGFVRGRGAVAYEYRIAREEVTTAQWMQFVNTFWTQGVQPNGFLIPSNWGAVRDLSYQGPGWRFMLQPGNPDAAMRPVFGIQWREAAAYCNWLVNGQSSDPASLLNGAYDASTFIFNPDGTFQDQRTHTPGARFWIPTWDEWLKAAHYDRNKNGPGQGGYWLYDTSSDTQPIAGPPGSGQTSAGYILPNFAAQAIPLGAYPDTVSPWGLLDTSGGTSEWTEETLEERFGARRYRVSDGNWAGNEIYPGSDLDSIFELATFDPFEQAFVGLRLAASIPSASAGASVFIALCSARLARRRRWTATLPPSSLSLCAFWLPRQRPRRSLAFAICRGTLNSTGESSPGACSMCAKQLSAAWGALCVALFLLPSPGPATFAQVGPPDYGIDFVTVGAPGNVGYSGFDPNGFVRGRGAVAYEYRIAREEVTTAQWMQFVNTFWTQGVQPNGFLIPSNWGAVRDLSYPGPGWRFMLQPGNPNAAMRLVFGIQWREAAEYCNWLCNGQSSDPSSLLNGAYDASTFTFNPNGGVNDQRTHTPGAPFWIPTWDEWLKAAHYDPNMNGPGQGGYWHYDTSSDTQPIPGPPGVGQTSAGYMLPNFGAQAIPLGAYPNTLSPWGLLDTSGGTSEWTEETFEELYGRREFRVADGNWAGDEIYPGSDLDSIVELGTFDPFEQSVFGLRIASSVPSVPTATCAFIALCSARFCERARGEGGVKRNFTRVSLDKGCRAQGARSLARC